MKSNIDDLIAYGKRIKWDSIYDSEEELVSDLLLSEKYQERYTKGYGYLESFKKQVLAGKTLSEKQMTQLKRLAPEVYKNVHWHAAYLCMRRP